MSVPSITTDSQLIEPQERVKKLAENGAKFKLDVNVPIQRYYQAGKFIIRQVDVYFREGNLEEAYKLYIKFLTIFLEKITEHPQFNTISPVDKDYIQKNLREVLPKTEKLKKKLLEKYTLEFKKRLEEEKLEAERLKKQEEKRLQEAELHNHTIKLKNHGIPIAAAAISNKSDITPKKPQTATSIPSISDNLAPRDWKLPPIPSIDRSTKPSSVSGDKSSLRDVIVPSQLMQHFLNLAYTNTMNNKETCGVLAGKLEYNKLIITHILIPKQTGSPDSCVTHNEEDIFDFQDQHNLITLGWIHTHPTQTAFLSSVDLHTHCAYQLMMAEAIAIVCAPKYDKTGFFHLTPDFGLNFIANCRQTGFHPHPSDLPLYMEATHFKLDSTARINAIDLRTK